MEIPVKVSGEPVEITVLLSNKFGPVYKPFHCVVCGGIVFEYNEDHVRSIVPSGRPMLDRPGKVYRCSNVITLTSTRPVYDLLYQVMDAAFNMATLDDVREVITTTAKLAENKVNTRCKALYYVS